MGLQVPWEQTAVEFTIDYIGSYNPEEELGLFQDSAVNPTVNNYVEGKAKRPRG